MFRLAVITPSCELPHEADALRIVGQRAEVYALHIRKPDWDVQKTRSLIEALPKEVRRKVRLHDHFELCAPCGLAGVHLNHRHPHPPQDVAVCTASCHSLQKVVQQKTTCEYVFLSPIFDSLSKRGYASGFSTQTLLEAAHEGLIDPKVFALGGVSREKIPFLKQTGFGGAAFLGAVWQNYLLDADLNAFEKHLQKLFALC